MAWKFLNFFKKKDNAKTFEQLEGTLVEEVNGLKKILRKQNIFLEAFKDEVFKALLPRELADLNLYMELADSFYYYDQALEKHHDTSISQHEAREIIWEKIDKLLAAGGLEMIRLAGDRFNAKFFEAVENVSTGVHDLVVVKVLQPGYLYQGNVMRPAKAVVGEPPPTE